MWRGGLPPNAFRPTHSEVACLDETQRLKAENRQLREQLARRFGQQRADGQPILAATARARPQPQ